jgi:hypothetical protein
MTRQPVKVGKRPAPKMRKVCKHPGRIFNKCKSCPRRAR